MTINQLPLTQSADVSPVIQPQYNNLARAINQIIPLVESPLFPVSDNVQLTGTSNSTTTTYLNSGVNVIESASSSNYCCLLPNPPIAGTQCIVVNTSGRTIVVYPSQAGGIINGVINGSMAVPSNGIPVQFICYENPAPGFWGAVAGLLPSGTWSSGTITVNTAATGDWVLTSGSSGSTLVYSSSYQNGSAAQGDALSFPLWIATGAGSVYPYRMFKPSAYFVPKTLRVYTNWTNLTDASAGDLWLTGSFSTNYYNVGTTTFTGNTRNAGATYYTNGFVKLSQQYSGAPLAVLSTNIGDPATCWDSFTLAANLDCPFTGDKYAGTITDGAGTHDLWTSCYLSLQWNPKKVLTGLQIRFEIDY